MKTVVIVSGGMDSVTLLHRVVSLNKEKPEVITFDYGQRHKKEIECAKWQCKYLGVKQYIIKLPIEELLSNSALVDKKLDLPEGHYTNRNQKLTVVPNRNMIFLSIAAALAENIGASYIYYAAHANDKTIYPDCRLPFVRALSKAIKLGTYKKPALVAPFVTLTKAEVLRLALQMKVPLEHTWSCYEGKQKACGKCATCQERLEAFAMNHARDPLQYEARR